RRYPTPAVLARLPLANRVPSGLKATDQTRPVWPCNVVRHLPVLTSHSLTIPSSLQLASRAPSGLKATERTQSLCPCSVLRHCPVLTCQILTLRSSPPLAR